MTCSLHLVTQPVVGLDVCFIQCHCQSLAYFFVFEVWVVMFMFSQCSLGFPIQSHAYVNEAFDCAGTVGNLVALV